MSFAPWLSCYYKILKIVIFILRELYCHYFWDLLHLWIGYFWSIVMLWPRDSESIHFSQAMPNSVIVSLHMVHLIQTVLCNFYASKFLLHQLCFSVFDLSRHFVLSRKSSVSLSSVSVYFPQCIYSWILQNFLIGCIEFVIPLWSCFRALLRLFLVSS